MKTKLDVPRHLVKMARRVEQQMAQEAFDHNGGRHDVMSGLAKDRKALRDAANWYAKNNPRERVGMLDHDLELRNLKIREERVKGAKIAALASEYNLSDVRIWQIVNHVES